MAQKEYRQLSCRDAGVDCDFLVRAETEEEVIRLASDHACRVHNLCELTPEIRRKMQASTKSVWCDHGCHDAPKKEMGTFRWFRG
jgi:predicted small metal-binding protein